MLRRDDHSAERVKSSQVYRSLPSLPRDGCITLISCCRWCWWVAAVLWRLREVSMSRGGALPLVSSAKCKTAVRGRPSSHAEGRYGDLYLCCVPMTFQVLLKMRTGICKIFLCNKQDNKWTAG
ncbi:uncharacterized protein LOC135102595 [Scylla paramamosain]|uniref:uncharacterized protein LOC135102595 n=1 Tax=Scylla paramamosain TaxID=85552 RepID=UPI003082EFB7